MGGPTEQRPLVRVMDRIAEKLALQQERALRSTGSDSGVQTQPAGLESPNSIRQQDGSRLHPERRRHKIRDPPEPNQRPSATGGQPQNRPRRLLSPRPIQRHSRSPFQEKTNTRMAHPTQRDKENLSDMGDPGSRPLRIQSVMRPLPLCDERLWRLCGTLHKRLQSPLALPSSLGVSTSEPHSSGSGSPQQGDGHIPHSSPRMEESILAPRPAKTSARVSNKNQRSRENASRLDHRAPPTRPEGPRTLSVESCGWSHRIADWTGEEKDLLKASWRPSSIATYKASWKIWSIWAREKGIPEKDPTGGDVARFLCYLHRVKGLAYRTILVYKSTLSTFCKRNFSSDFLVRRILKAIALSRPPARKAPTWNPATLVNWLEHNAVNPESLYDVSRRTAVLLLLASGRRVHDLTLLNVSREAFIDKGSHIILWPEYGSKTDSDRHRQSGWRLVDGLSQNINPVYWLRKLKELSRNRRGRLKSLFLTTRGETQPASRTIMGNWIKSLMKEAGIDATPGSTRTAVASQNWVEGLPTEEILKRGNWTRESTFQKFYRKEIQKSTLPPGNLLAAQFIPE